MSNVETPQTGFYTSDLHDYELNLINILLTQSKHDEQSVIRACEYVLNRLRKDAA